MNTEKLVLAALKEKSPALHRQLAQSGKLQAFVKERSEEIADQRATLTMEIANRNGLQKADPMKAVGIMSQADSLATESVLSAMLEFPQDETSPQRPAETTPSAMVT